MLICSEPPWNYICKKKTTDAQLYFTYEWIKMRQTGWTKKKDEKEIKSVKRGKERIFRKLQLRACFSTGINMCPGWYSHRWTAISMSVHTLHYNVSRHASSVITSDRILTSLIDMQINMSIVPLTKTKCFVDFHQQLKGSGQHTGTNRCFPHKEKNNSMHSVCRIYNKVQVLNSYCKQSL